MDRNSCRRRVSEVARTIRSDLTELEKCVEIIKIAKENGVQITFNDVLDVYAKRLFIKGSIKILPAVWRGKVVEKARHSAGSSGPCVYKNRVIELINEGNHTRKDIVETIVREFSGIKADTVRTYLSDATSWKFTKIGDGHGLVVKDTVTLFLKFDGSTRPVDIASYVNPSRRRNTTSNTVEDTVEDNTEQPVENVIDIRSAPNYTQSNCIFIDGDRSHIPILKMIMETLKWNRQSRPTVTHPETGERIAANIVFLQVNDNPKPIAIALDPISGLCMFTNKDKLIAPVSKYVGSQINQTAKVAISYGYTDNLQPFCADLVACIQ